MTLRVPMPVFVGLAWAAMFGPLFLFFMWLYKVEITGWVVFKLAALSVGGGLAFGYALLFLFGRRNRDAR